MRLAATISPCDGSTSVLYKPCMQFFILSFIPAIVYRRATSIRHYKTRDGQTDGSKFIDFSRPHAENNRRKMTSGSHLGTILPPRISPIIMNGMKRN